jgi:hypothetical protein
MPSNRCKTQGCKRKHKKPASVVLHYLHMYRFVITFALCLMMRKAHG